MCGLPCPAGPPEARARRRVPLADAHRYIAALRARPGAPEVRVLQFAEDTHALDKPQTEFEQWVTAAAWLERHLTERVNE